MGVEDMVTLVAHAEFVANSRPLSYVTQNDQYNILTPNMLIFGRDVHQENWLNQNQLNDPDYTIVSQHAKQMEAKNNKKRNVVDRKPTTGDVVILCNEKGKPTKISRIVDTDKKMDQKSDLAKSF